MYVCEYMYVCMYIYIYIYIYLYTCVCVCVCVCSCVYRVYYILVCMVGMGWGGRGGAEEELLGNPAVRKFECKPVVSTVTISICPFLSTLTP